MRALILLFCLSAGWSAPAAIPSQALVDHLRTLVRQELDMQVRLKSGAQCSEEDALETADRRVALLEQTLATMPENKSDKYEKLISFFRDKMIKKCCQLSGKTPSFGNVSRGFGKGKGKGGGRGRGRKGE